MPCSLLDNAWGSVVGQPTFRVFGLWAGHELRFKLQFFEPMRRILCDIGKPEEENCENLLDESFVGVTKIPINTERIGLHLYTRIHTENESSGLRTLRICGLTQSSAQQYSK